MSTSSGASAASWVARGPKWSAGVAALSLASSCAIYGPASHEASDEPDCELFLVCEDLDGDGVGAFEGEAVVAVCGEWQSGSVPEECSDCDDTDPTRFQWGRPDLDGDGWGAGELECLGSNAGTQWQLDEIEEDCDDDDPEVQVFGYLDADGDGHVVGQSGECVAYPLPSGYTTTVQYYADCDDSDPELQSRRYWDGDGDGSSSPEAEAACVPSGAEDPHYTRNLGQDCDDDDPLIAPFMPEQSGDDIDSNCDGAVDPIGCAGGDDTEEGCSCSARPVDEQLAPQDACAGQPDLYVVRIRECIRECVGTVGTMLVVGNRGDTAYVGQGTVGVRGSGYQPLWEQPVALSVQPGETQHIGAPFGFGVIVQLDAPGDCDGGTVAIEVPQTFIDCLL